MFPDQRIGSSESRDAAIATIITIHAVKTLNSHRRFVAVIRSEEAIVSRWR